MGCNSSHAECSESPKKNSKKRYAKESAERVVSIDLHGKYEKEAKEAVTATIMKALDDGDVSQCELITGKGLHSDQTGKPVLRPAILALCNKELGYNAFLNPKNQGRVICWLKKSDQSKPDPNKN